jgi:hypothetical protein
VAQIVAQDIKLPKIILSSVPFEIRWNGFSEATQASPAFINGFAQGPLTISSETGSAKVSVKGNVVVNYLQNDGSTVRQKFPVG